MAGPPNDMEVFEFSQPLTIPSWDDLDQSYMQLWWLTNFLLHFWVIHGHIYVLTDGLSGQMKKRHRQALVPIEPSTH